MKNRRFAPLLLMAALVLTGLFPFQVVQAAASCVISYTQNDWGSGATVNIVINNPTTTAINNWTLAWSFPGNQTITNLWNGAYTQTGQAVSVSNLSYNGSIPANGGSVNFGFNMNYSGANVAPTAFTLNGVACGDNNNPTNTYTPTRVTSTPTGTASITTTPTSVTATPSKTVTITPTVITNTPSKTVTTTASVSPTASRTSTVTNTPSITMTASKSPTPSQTSVVLPGDIHVQIKIGNSDNNQQSKFMLRVQNTGENAYSNLKVRLFFTPDGTAGASTYVMEKYYDSSSGATISGPALHGTAYAFTVSFGTASLAPLSAWEIDLGLHTNNWYQGYDGFNDFWHTSASLPAAYADWPSIPAYSNGNVVWGSEAPGSPTHTPTPTSTFTPTITPGPSPTNTPIWAHIDNPFVGATFYRNVDYVASVNAAATLKGGDLGAKMRQVANYPTFVWLDSIAAVNGTDGYPRSLAGHLDAALAQGANAIGIVIYDLPNRDCSALASNGELLIAQNGFNRYKTEYIDVIYSVISQSKYLPLRIVAVIEPDSLPNLVTNLSFAKCQEANGPGGYREATQYTLNKLSPLPNFYAYIDIGHHGWLGWAGAGNNFPKAITLIADTIKGTTRGVNSIDGFISNTANTTVTQELYMTANQQIGSNPVRSAKFHDWNTYIDEKSFGAAWRTAMIAEGFPSTIGMLIDTSRNGWGGANRPTGPSLSTDLNIFVNEGRIDRRIHKGNWCNQSGAGIGARPTANPFPGFDAFVWVKPPGESDGSSTLVPVGPDNPGGKGFDRMCDPTYTGNSLNGTNLTGALANAPVSGRWFQAQFEELVQNAYPAFVLP